MAGSSTDGSGRMSTLIGTLCTAAMQPEWMLPPCAPPGSCPSGAPEPVPILRSAPPARSPIPPSWPAVPPDRLTQLDCTIVRLRGARLRCPIPVRVARPASVRTRLRAAQEEARCPTSTQLPKACCGAPPPPCDAISGRVRPLTQGESASRRAQSPVTHKTVTQALRGEDAGGRTCPTRMSWLSVGPGNCSPHMVKQECGDLIHTSERPCQLETMLDPILQRRKLRHREVMSRSSPQHMVWS